MNEPQKLADGSLSTLYQLGDTFFPVNSSGHFRARETVIHFSKNTNPLSPSTIVSAFGEDGFGAFWRDLIPTPNTIQRVQQRGGDTESPETHGEFKREERYIVVKLKDNDAESIEELRDFLRSYQMPTQECVVVEPDWPNYEDTWKAIEQSSKGTYVSPSQASENGRLNEAAARKEGADLAILVALQVLHTHDQPVIAKDLIDADVGIEELINALDCDEGVDVDSLKWICLNEYPEHLETLSRKIDSLRENQERDNG